MWNLPRPVIEPMSPTLAGGLLTIGQPMKFLSPLLKSDLFLLLVYLSYLHIVNINLLPDICLQIFSPIWEATSLFC